MSVIHCNIDGKEVIVQDKATILEAAQTVQIRIPTLCHLNLEKAEVKHQVASCRICVVEVEGRKNLVPACATQVVEGMVIKTHTPRVLKARKTVLELILSNHPKECLRCIKSGDCELQEISKSIGIKESIKYEGLQTTYEVNEGISIVRDMSKCIMCRRCETMCNVVQTIGVLSGVNRGFEASVSPAFNRPLSETECVQCGQCVAVCPTGALAEKDNIDEVVEALYETSKTVIVQVAPAVRASLGELFGYPAGTLITGKMVTALKAIGFDYVFDTDFAADMTIMEEGYELIDRLVQFEKQGITSNLPIITSCCPSWVRFFETQYSTLIHLPSTVRSPQQIFGSVAKTYFAKKINKDKKDIVVVSIMPCVAKKSEANREEFKDDVDIVLTTRELARLIKQFNIQFNTLEDSDFDEPLGDSTGAGVIFGTTGGVLEAALRTVYEKITGKALETIDFKEVRGLEGIKTAEVQIGKYTLNVATVYGLGRARKIMEELKEGNPNHYHVIEVMACPGGCIGGGGQPYHYGNSEILIKRQEALYEEDKNKPIRKSHENPWIIEAYKEYFKNPLSDKAHELLHTTYRIK